MTEAGALTITAGHQGHSCTLTLAGALDLTTAAAFLEHVAQEVDERTERLVLDLAGLAFLDCAGARALVMAAYAAPAGCPVLVRSISPLAARLIDLLSLDVRQLRQQPSAGPEGHRIPGPAGATGRSHPADRPHTLHRAGQNLPRVPSPEAS